MAGYSPRGEAMEKKLYSCRCCSDLIGSQWKASNGLASQQPPRLEHHLNAVRMKGATCHAAHSSSWLSVSPPLPLPNPKRQVQVVYVLDGSTLTTYNVDPQTLDTTQVGTLSVTQYLSPELTTSPDGHFVYYTDSGLTPITNNKLWVYATDSTGSPQSPAVLCRRIFLSTHSWVNAKHRLEFPTAKIPIAFDSVQI